MTPKEITDIFVVLSGMAIFYALTFIGFCLIIAKMLRMITRLKADILNSELRKIDKHNELERIVQEHFLEIIKLLQKNKK